MTREDKIQVILEVMIASEEDSIMLAAEYQPENNVLIASILSEETGETELFRIQGDADSTGESLKLEFESIMEAAVAVAKQLATSSLN